MTDVPPTLPPLEGIPDPLAGAAPPLPALPPAGVRGPSRTRAELARAEMLALVVGAGWLVGQLAWWGLRGDFALVPPAYVLAFGVGPVVAGSVCLLAAVSAGRLGVGARVGLLALVALLSPAAFIVGAMASPLPHAAAATGSFGDGVVCLSIAVAWTLLPLLLAALALRATFVAASRFRSAALGSGAGLFAAAALTMHCPISGAFHVGLGHGGAILASALLGAFVLSRATRA